MLLFDKNVFGAIKNPSLLHFISKYIANSFVSSETSGIVNKFQAVGCSS